MLVLSRCVGERIVINGSITIQVLEIRHDRQVRLGFVASQDDVIDREEIHLRKQQEGKA